MLDVFLVNLLLKVVSKLGLIVKSSKYDLIMFRTSLGVVGHFNQMTFLIKYI